MSLFPEIEPYAQDWLDVSGGHRIYYEQCGNVQGVPVLFLHGGPGSSCNPGHRRFFDPRHYHIILFDQRGCGKSTPCGEVRDNTTAHLIADMEQLRRALNVERWLLFGGSWGSTLALAYAQAHAPAVLGLILRGIFLASAEELDWYCYGLKNFASEAWQRFANFLPEEKHGNLLQHYHQAIHQPDLQQAGAAAQAWNGYETELMMLGQSQPQIKSSVADELMLARARVQTHYLINCCFLKENKLIENLHKIRHLPAAIVHGRLDLICPVQTAQRLQRAWPEAQLKIVENAGHSSSHPALAAELIAATESFRKILSRVPAP
ncbi:MAG: prolyl aminopeptidase [Burkholderiales bacterium]